MGLVVFELPNMISGVMFGFTNVRRSLIKNLSAIVMRSFRDNRLARMRADPRACPCNLPRSWVILLSGAFYFTAMLSAFAASIMLGAKQDRRARNGGAIGGHELSERGKDGASQTNPQHITHTSFLCAARSSSPHRCS